MKQARELARTTRELRAELRKPREMRMLAKQNGYGLSGAAIAAN